MGKYMYPQGHQVLLWGILPQIIIVIPDVDPYILLCIYLGPFGIRCPVFVKHSRARIDSTTRYSMEPRSLHAEVAGTRTVLLAVSMQALPGSLTACPKPLTPNPHMFQNYAGSSLRSMRQKRIFHID